MKTRLRYFSFLIFLGLVIPVLSIQASQITSKSPREVNLAREVYDGVPQDHFLDASELISELPNKVFRDPSWGPSWSKLAYQSYEGDNWDIYLVDSNGNSSSRITTNSSIESFPFLKHGTGEVLFVSNRDVNTEIYKTDSSGANPINLTQNPAYDYNPGWSLDGSRIVFNSLRTGNSEIFVMNSDGSNVFQLTYSPAYDGQPSWSPSGDEVVFSSSRSGQYELWVMNADGSNLRQLTYGANALYPAWSPVGDKIAYANDGDYDGWLELWLVNADGSYPHQIYDVTYYEDVDSWKPAWSPDGKLVSFTVTHWTFQANQWYWYASYVKVLDLSNTYAYDFLSSNNRVWATSWAATDVSAPNPCTLNLSEIEHWNPFLVSWSTTDVGEAGIRDYDVEFRNASDGNWNTLLTNTANTSTSFQGVEGGYVEFRCRARDQANNEANWGNGINTTIDTSIPDSQVLPLPRYAETPITVRWTGYGGGITGYDVYVKEGIGDWELWQENVSVTSAVFNGISGQTYSFRSQARDTSHLEPWEASSQASVTFYATTLSGKVQDIQGVPVSVPVIGLNPGAVYTTTEPVSGNYIAYLIDAEDYHVNFLADGYGLLPETTLTLTGNTEFDATLPPLDNAIVGGGFESGDLLNWEITGSGTTVLANAHHTGQYGLQFNHSANQTTAIKQRITINNTFHKPTLSLLYYIPTNLSGDTFQIQVTNGLTTTTVLNTADFTSGWQHIWADLSAYISQTVTLTLTMNNTTGVVWVDEVALGSWETPQVTTLSSSKWPYQQAFTLVITGSNFISPTAVFLNEIELTDVLWISDSQLQINVPANIPGGMYHLYVVNPNGTQTLAPDTILTQEQIFLPIISKPRPSVTADWYALGYDPGHTGYNQGESGASRYTLAWAKTLPFTGSSLEQIAIADGVVIASVPHWYDTTGGIIGLDMHDGHELWRKDSIYTITDPPAIGNGGVYVQQSGFAYPTYLTCLDLQTGAVHWESISAHETSQENFSPLVVGNKVFAPVYRDRIYAFQADTGQQHWFTSVSPEYFSWTPSYSNNVLYSWTFGDFGAYDINTGSLLWHLSFGYGGSTKTTPVIVGDITILADRFELKAINLVTREVAWSKSGDYEETIPAVADSVVYAINNGLLEARHISNGSLLWSYNDGNTMVHAPIVAGNYVYAASEESTYVLNRTTHELESYINDGGWLAVTNGYLFIADKDNIIYAYRAEEP